MSVQGLLASFAAELQARGFRVGGLVQHTSRDGFGRKTGMELVALDSGEAVQIAQKLGPGAGCTVDTQGVAAATAVLRRAIKDRVDLVVVNKFGPLETEGGGLADEAMSAMAEGVPLLIAVGADRLPRWLEFCGGLCDVLTPDPAALWRWWGPHRLIEDLRRGVADTPVRRVVSGARYLMVEGPYGLGLAWRPEGGDVPPPVAGISLAVLAAGVDSWNPLDNALGWAAINAHYNRFDLAAESKNGLDLFADVGGRVVAVGAFPGLASRLPNALIVECRPEAGHYPAEAAEWLLPGAEAAVVTATTLANRSLPRLLEQAQGARVALVGPSAPLTPRLFSYGVEAVCGFIATDADALADAVAAGGGARAIRPFGRPATLRVAAQP
jgi:nucleoside-triphosphatase THEP1